ncbi:glycoside hydrolase family 78 protein [Aliifodinibius salicampi]|uniref:alpha-L-rhamnosidase n=1 Tax=Fodinibius salicampi TaxID=1920655 RepID=A0ABT3PZJ3_9BACT|nr:alpha-L-rhamnosidase [Fodinibius salicampi]MCW9713280.1 glycoside hydrolase family 78 protein [Fodinibius salicampi]
MKKYLILILIIIVGISSPVCSAGNDGELSVTNLQTEYFENPIGIDQANPRLAWKLKNSERNTLQAAYQIQVAKGENDFSSGNIIWDTGRVESESSIHNVYEGPDLESGQRYYWRVRVWNQNDGVSEWSNTSFWEMGLLNTDDWQFDWIEPGLDQDSSEPQPVPMLRTEFSVPKAIKEARAYVTAHGLYEMEINGEKVGDQVFTPGWTSYNNRLQYQTYDVTEYLQSGDNAIGVMLGDGWYRGYIGFNNQRNYYGENLALLAQIKITYEDGTTETFGTDDSWKATTGPILKSDIYNGEAYDARLEKEGWANPGYDDRNWIGVRVVSDSESKEQLVAPEGPPVRKIQELRPVEILRTPEGDTVVDMGQNMVGWIRLKVSGSAGTKVTMEHAEVLDKDGNFYTENLRAANQINTYTLKGEGEEVWEPRFTFQGFRYVKVEGYPGELTKDGVTGVVIHSDMEPTGHFESSNPLINQLQHNIVWGQKGNFLDVPTDCPQRDERLGWTGDIQVFAGTACLNMDAAGFLTKWLRDLKADQLSNGSIPHVVPNVLGEDWAGAAGWADAGVIVPWTMYQSYGDKRILETQYESMKEWVEFMREEAQSDETTYLWDNTFTFGDWLSFNSDASDYPGAYTDKELISTAYFARSTDLLHRTAEILGNNEDAKEYANLLEQVKKAFQREYITASGRVMSNTQTAYLLALKFGLLPDSLEQDAVGHLVEDINERGHLTTGFLGTPHLNPILSEYGHDKEAYKLLNRKEYPSWLYPVTIDATTIWERWDGIKPDSSFQNPGMNSFNHYAYGAIGEWLHKNVAGIKAEAPGYKKITIAPQIGGNLTHARSLLNTMYGRVESDWTIDGDQFFHTVTIPANTRATVTFLNTTPDSITEGGKDLTDTEGIHGIEKKGDNVEVKIGSGTYHFIYGWQHLEKKSGNSDTNNKSGEEKDLAIDHKLAALIADKDARQILNEELPELMDSPWLSQVMGYPLERAAQSLPGQFSISNENLQAIDQMLSNLNQ